VYNGNGTPPAVTLAYDEATNRITTTGYSYDLNGNLEHIPQSQSMPEISDITWDLFDRMTAATANGTATEYKYDAFGRRVARVTPNGTDTFFYDMGGRLLATYLGQSAVGSEQSAVGSRQSAVGSKQSNPSTPELTVYMAGQKLRQWADRLGSVRYANAGGVVSHYYPYGELVAGANNTGFKFAETYRDDSGLDYAMNRYYASGIGRFLSVDPYGGSARPRLPQSWNRYAYVRNDPTNYSDPTGLFPQKKPGWKFKSGSLDCYFDNAEYSCAYMDGGGGVYDSPVDIDDVLVDDEGGGGEPPFENISHSGFSQLAILSMLDTLKMKIEPDSPCGEWLGSGLSTMITELQGDNGPTSKIAHGDFTGEDANAGAASFVGPNEAILVNNNGSFFNPARSVYGFAGGSRGAQGAILIHEVAHWLRYLGTGASGFIHDDGTDEMQRANRDLIMEKCGHVLYPLGGVIMPGG